MSWETFFAYDADAVGDAMTEELQVRRTGDGLQFRVVTRPTNDEDADPEVEWTSDKDLAEGDIVEALEELRSERDLTEELIAEAAEELEPYLSAAEWRALSARLRA